ncbi:MAG: hypothetical protein NUV50_10440 [Rhodospirillales bacterium]|nr:hypothetical protein [Rhodospirillales bacterium]
MQSLILNVFPAQLKRSETVKTQFVISLGFVTPQRLIVLGIVANALFWSGLLLPFNSLVSPEIGYFHVFVAMLGVGLALGGAVAVMMMVVYRVTVRLFSPELIAAVMHFTVVIAFVTLSLSAAV